MHHKTKQILKLLLPSSKEVLALERLHLLIASKPALSRQALFRGLVIAKIDYASDPD